MNGGRFDFDDGGTYCGGWEEGKAHGHGVCTGPKGQGEYSGAWHYGFEVSGVYTWPSGNTFEGQWQNGKRHGLGVEKRGRWVYKGEWTQGFKGRYGIRQSTNSIAKFEGTWANGLQDGYGTETYADGGTYQGQWLRGMRHGYGVRKSVPYAVAAKFRSRSHAHASLTSLRSDQEDDAEGPEKGRKTDENSRGGFVLRAKSEPPARKRSLSERSVAVKRTILQGFRIKKQHSAGDINQRVVKQSGAQESTPKSMRSSGSMASCTSDDSGHTGVSHEPALAPEETVDPNATETYMGEWKNDKRSGFGVSERSDGLKYEGEWYNNKKYGYGVTTFKDGHREEGKYKANVLISSQRKSNILFVRSSKLRERIEAAAAAAVRAAQLAVQKADIGVSRTSTARDRAEQSIVSALQARDDSDIARVCAKQWAPEFHQPGTDMLKKRKEQADLEDYLPSNVRLPQSTSVESPLVPNNVHMAHGHNQYSSPRSKSLVIPKTNLNAVGNLPLLSNNSASDDTTPMETPQGEFKSIQSAIQPPSRPQQLVREYSDAADIRGRTQPDLSQSSRGRPPPQTLVAEYTVEQQSGRHGGTPTAHQNYVGRSRREPSIAEETYGSPMHQMYGGEMQPNTSGYNDRNYDAQADYLQHHSEAPQSQERMERRSSRDRMDQQWNVQQPSNVYQNSPLRRNQRGGSGDRLYGNPNMMGLTSPSPSVSRTGSQSSSRHSVMSDHFDQYSMAANPKAAKLHQANMVRHGRPISRGTARFKSPLDQSSDSDTSPSSGIYRRTTLATPTDYKSLAGNPLLSNMSPLASGNSSTSAASSTGLLRRNKISIAGGPPGLTLEMIESARGSLPNVSTLETSSLQMTREEIARLSSRRREEIRRMRDEEELLRHNPLRYLFHPALRQWIYRRKLALLVVLVNVTLTFLFYQLLTYRTEYDDGDDYE